MKIKVERVAMILAAVFFYVASAQVRPEPVFGDYAAEPRIGMHVDTDRLVRRLSELGANTYMWLIWHSANDWDDLKVFLPKARQAGITVWVYLVPHSETPFSNKRFLFPEPYRLDYIRWAEEIAKLSLLHSNLVGYVIDDFWGNVSPDRFSLDYIRQMTTAGKAVNPKLKFYPLMYFQQFGTRFVDDLAPLIDGVVAAYPQDSASVENALTFLEDRFLLPKRVTIIFPGRKPSEKGDHGFISLDARVTDAANAQLSFRYRDNFNGSTEGYRRLQVRVDDQVVWDEDIAGHDDDTVTLSLAKVVSGRQSVKLSLGVFDIKGVGNFAVEATFENITACGLNLEEAKHSQDVAGSFSANFEQGRVGAGQFHLPLIVMPSGNFAKYKKSYNKEATLEDMIGTIKMSMELAQEGRIEGVVTYCLDKQDGSESFEAVQKLFEAVRKRKE